MNRCNWPSLENSEIYKEYHDHEWGVASYDDRYLFEMIVLESFHCGLSWLIILRKRESFREAFDNFIPEIVAKYDEGKIYELLGNKGIVRHIGKIKAAINNANKYIEIQNEFGSFSNYIWSFTDNKVMVLKGDNFVTKNELSDKVTKDLKRRGFKFLGSVTTYSYLEAIGVMNNHYSGCDLSSKNRL
ncbi:DNA-3-methyladenine glycosylase 1 [Candidatus Izimaplasma bacterium HR1]|jgi:DNA-3-methyladenine glycosylase I|uniref:DNA-3-methyladenine glycosylase I n=1 Tax=Candidatus Izimoplasma sp. HR1 TaxID=1541959 RepID=UPI0004F7C56C|nr:DNA-3-methyladenine glycosylase 1 [Candidatus Izimaplasma bacterium HR1]